MLSYQSINLKGMIHTMRTAPYQGSLADVQIDGFNGLLTVPLDAADRHQIGDMIEVNIIIDRIINVSRSYHQDIEGFHG